MDAAGEDVDVDGDVDVDVDVELDVDVDVEYSTSFASSPLDCSRRSSSSLRKTPPPPTGREDFVMLLDILDVDVDVDVDIPEVDGINISPLTNVRESLKPSAQGNKVSTKRTWSALTALCSSSSQRQYPLRFSAGPR